MYHAGQGVFGVACTRMTPGRVGDYEQPTGSFKLLDAHSFQRKSCKSPGSCWCPYYFPELHHFLCDTGEEPSSVLSLPTNGAGSSPALVLGTVYIRPEEKEPSQGRILLFSVLQTEGERGVSVRSLHTLASQEVGGCVYALAHLSENYIIAAINSSVRFSVSGIEH